ncbi:hypothetical protein [Hyalangium sp.]|uniref:hypothetical protein n=1 Tax=Hyalangium sp. TaxID=2028555 RepID=UPI002D429CF3|nr:hypothetical protein [Hyalangium sp.]HYH97272.1 hypothetical protein [Hyalangium sp.]
MSNDSAVSFWRSLDALLQAYENGDLGRVEFFGALLGLLDITEPEVIYRQLPERLRTPFVEHARIVARENDRLYNVLTEQPLPAEALLRLKSWLASV